MHFVLFLFLYFVSKMFLKDRLAHGQLHSSPAEVGSKSRPWDNDDSTRHEDRFDIFKNEKRNTVYNSESKHIIQFEFYFIIFW